MKRKNTLSTLVKALACFVFAVALVLFPPSASNAGMHEKSQTASVALDKGALSVEQGGAVSASIHHYCGSGMKAGAGQETPSQCCSDICLSVVFAEQGPSFAQHTASSAYLAPRQQNASFELLGLLRPPQLLI